MNRFGTASTLYPLYDPRTVREARMRFRRDSIPLLDRANSFYCPSGRNPCRGWILMARGDYNKLDHYSTLLELEVGNPTQTNNIGTLSNLAIVQAQCVTRGLAADANALYLVEVTDRRGVLCNRWFQFPLQKFYNIRAAAYPQTFYSGSLNGGAAWSWSSMIGDIWGTMSTFLGTYPGLPITPTGVPEGWDFPGVPAWDALCDVLDHLGLTVACDLTSTTAPYTIVSEGAADTTFTALQTKYKTNLEDDQEWIDTGSGRVPSSVVVLFKRRNSIYGSEETVRYDSLQWEMTPYYSVTVAAPSTFSAAAGTHHLWSDFTVRYDQDGNPLSADTTTAAAIAAERVTQYFARIYHATLGSMTQTYAGALPFTTGSQVDGVCWYQDYRDDDRQGWRTQIVRCAHPPWPDLWR